MALVGAIFRDANSAESAVARLTEHGFLAEDIALLHVESGAPLVAATGLTTVGVGNEVRRRYAKHLSPGQVLLVLHGHARLDEVRQLLQEAGGRSLRPEARYRASSLSEEEVARLRPASSRESAAPTSTRRTTRKSA